MNRSAVREIQGIGRFKFREGELEDFKRLSAQLMEIVRSKDTGTLKYEIYSTMTNRSASSSSGTGTQRR